MGQFKKKKKVEKTVTVNVKSSIITQFFTLLKKIKIKKQLILALSIAMIVSL